jgi:hypothetical protein
LPSVSDYNFAKLDFIWGDSIEKSKIAISIIDINNIVRLKVQLNYSDLSFQNDLSPLRDEKCVEVINSRFKSISEYLDFYTNSQNRIYIIVFIGLIIMGVTILLYSYLSLYILYWLCLKLGIVDRIRLKLLEIKYF